MRPRSKALLRRLHGAAGLAVGLALLPLILSGILLHHPGWLGSPSNRTLSMAVDPHDPQAMLRGSEQGLALSEDGGSSWRDLPLLMAPEQVTALAFAPDQPGRVYAVLRDQGLLRSEDGGRIWERIDLGFHPAAEGLKLTGLALDATGRIHLICDRGVLIAGDDGESWRWEGGEPAEAATSSLLLALHGGHIGPSWLPGLWEFLAWGLLGLILSGSILFSSSARARRAAAGSRGA